MDHGAQLARLVHLVEKTGERVVVSFSPGAEPVVLLPLSMFEHLTTHQMDPSIPESFHKKLDSVDTWDGEYDAEQIFAHVQNTPTSDGAPFPERMRSSLTQATEAFQTFSAKEKVSSPVSSILPHPSDRVHEERFSLGLG